MENYAIYLRKSRADIELEEVEKFETLKKHKKILTELAEKQHLNIVEIYEEIVSGESITDRPQMQRLLNDVFQKKYRGVLVVELERLTRGSAKDQGLITEAFKYTNTLIITPQKIYDPTNPMDQQFFELGMVLSRIEYQTILRRMQTGKLESIKEGNYMGSLPPYGYDIDKRGKNDRTLKVNEQSQYVKLIFDWYVNDRMTVGAIARKLTAMGVPTRTGKTEWHRGTIYDILRNDLYIGMIRWNKRKVTREMEEGNVVKKKRRASIDDYVLVKGKHEPLISKEIFDKAQELFVGQVPINANTILINPLAGLIFCKHCGKTIRYQAYKGRKDNVKPIYYHTDSVNCKVKSAPSEQIIDALIQSLKEVIEDYELKINSGEDNEPTVNVVEQLEKELATQLVRKDEIYDYFEKKIYNLETFIERRDKIENRIETLKKEIKNEKEKSTDVVDYEDKIITYKKAIESLKDNDIPVKAKNDFLKEIIERIEYDCEDLGRNKGGNVTLDVYLL